MKPQRDVPEAWAELMARRGFTHNGKPSARALADKAGVTVNAALRVIHRENWGEATAQAIGEAVDDHGFVRSWLDLPHMVEYKPPTAAHHLTTTQRKLVDALIRELVKGASDAGTAEAEKNPRVATRDDVGLAAYRGPSEGKELRRHLDALGEESQDPEG